MDWIGKANTVLREFYCSVATKRVSMCTLTNIQTVENYQFQT